MEIEKFIENVYKRQTGVALWKVKSKLRQQQEENRFVKNSARITREYERVRFDKEDEYVAEYKDQHSKHPKMKDYPVTRLFDSLSALKAEADLKILEEQAVLSEVGLERLYELSLIHIYSGLQATVVTCSAVFFQYDINDTGSSFGTEFGRGIGDYFDPFDTFCR